MRLPSFLLVLSLALAGCAAADDAPGVTVSSMCRDLTETLQAWEEVGFSGAFALSSSEEECSAGFGAADPRSGRPVTAETVFGIGSVTKAVTASAALDLVETGELALDDRVGEHLPSLSAPVADLTVGQLLLHTGGLTGTHGQDHEPLEQPAGS